MYVIILGCGRVGSELAQLLSQEGHNVAVIDKERTSFERLGVSFNGLTVAGNGFDLDLLRQIETEKADAFCAVTNGDNTNLISAQVAKKIFRVPKVIARIYDPQRARIYSALGLDIINGTMLFAAMIRDKIIESRFTSYLIESKEIGILAIEVKEQMINKSVQEINLSGQLLIAAIRRVDGIVIPEPQTVLRQGDVLMAVVKVDQLEQLKAKLDL